MTESDIDFDQNDHDHFDYVELLKNIGTGTVSFKIIE